MRKLLLLSFVVFLLYSCAEDNIVAHQQINNTVQFRSGCDVVQSSRLRANDDYAIIVSQCYESGQLTDVNYQIDESLPDDKYGILDLSSGMSSLLVRVDVVNRTISGIESTSAISGSFSNINAGNIDYFCECNDKNPIVNDCVKRSNSNLKYCDGNFCIACSVVVDIGGGAIITPLSSVVILPNNL